MHSKSGNKHLMDGKHRGVEQLVARQAHNLEVVRSSRASATKKCVTCWKSTRYAQFV